MKVQWNLEFDSSGVCLVSLNTERNVPAVVTYAEYNMHELVLFIWRGMYNFIVKV